MAFSSKAVITLVSCAPSFLAGTANSNAFRGTDPAASVRHMQIDDLVAALGHRDRVTGERSEKIKEALLLIFASMRKNEHGNWEHAAVRYALHRVLVLRSSSSATGVLDDRVPAYVQSMFEQRLRGRGLRMHEIAILAASLEHLVRDEAEAMLRVAYQVHAVPIESHLKKEQVEDVVDTYMAMLVLGGNVSSMALADIKAKQAEI